MLVEDGDEALALRKEEGATHLAVVVVPLPRQVHQLQRQPHPELWQQRLMRTASENLYETADVFLSLRRRLWRHARPFSLSVG